MEGALAEIARRWSEFQRADQIATGALAVATIALCVSIVAALYSRAQAKAATRGDRRATLGEIERAQSLVAGLITMLKHDVGVAKANKSAYLLRGSGPEMNRAPESYPGTLARLAEATLRSGEFAGVRSTQKAELLWKEIAAKDQALVRVLNEIRDRVANGTAALRIGEFDTNAEEIIRDFEQYETRLREVKEEILAILEARARKVRAKLR